MAGRRRVSSSKTRATLLDWTINGLKGFSSLTLRLSSSTLILSSNDLSALRRSLLFANFCSSPISVRHRQSLPLRRQSLLFVSNVTSLSSPPSLKFDLFTLSHSISLLFGCSVTRLSLSLICLHR